MSHSLAHTALLLVDVQKGYDHPTHWGYRRSNPAFEQNLTTLLNTFREAAQRHSNTLAPAIIHVLHSSPDPASPLHPSSSGVAFQDYATPLPSEPVFMKSTNSVFIGTHLEVLLKKRGIRRLLIAGLTTDQSVSTSVRMANNLAVTDYVDEDDGELKHGEVILVQDATATWEKGGFDAETVHQVHVESLKGEFCDVVSTRNIVKELQDPRRGSVPLLAPVTLTPLVMA